MVYASACIAYDPMTELPLDFDSILAYLIPGFVAVAGLPFLSPNLQRLFCELSSQPSASTLLLLTIVALVAGILLSDVRVATLHWTCGINLKWIRREPSFASIPSEPIAYGKLVEERRLKAFQETKKSEQTPYRFHGNTLLARDGETLFASRGQRHARDVDLAVAAARKRRSPVSCVSSKGAMKFLHNVMDDGGGALAFALVSPSALG